MGTGSMTLLAHSFFIFFDHLAQGQTSRFAHCVISFMCAVTKKGAHVTYPCYHHHADLLSVSVQLRKNHYNLVRSYQVSTVFSSRTVYTE